MKRRANGLRRSSRQGCRWERPIGRYGITTQLYVVRTFFDDHPGPGIGFGPYLARDKYGGDKGHDITTVAGDVSVTATYRFHPSFAVRASWNRIITDWPRH